MAEEKQPQEELQDEAQEQEEELNYLGKEMKDYKKMYMRAMADYQNLQKDLSKQKDTMRVNMMEQVARMILPVYDNFCMAFDHQPDTDEKTQQWIAGIGHIKTQYEQLITSLGLQPILAEGEVNPELHEVVDTEEGEEDNQIVRVVQTGYTFNSRVIRPTKVVATKAN